MIQCKYFVYTFAYCYSLGNNNPRTGKKTDDLFCLKARTVIVVLVKLRLL